MRPRWQTLSMLVPGVLVSLGTAGSISAQAARGSVVDLVGALGLPGAIVALAVAFFLGAKAVIAMRQPPSSQLEVALARLESQLDQIPTREHMAKVAQENRHDTRSHVTALTIEVSALNNLLRQHLREPEA